MGNLRRRLLAEPSLPSLVGVLACLALLSTLPGPAADVRHVLTLFAILAQIPLAVLNPLRFDRQEHWARVVGVGLAIALVAGTLLGLGETVASLLLETGVRPLVSAVQAWAGIVLGFAILLWQLDGGGPVSRVHAHEERARRRDVRFAVREPRFLDYLRASVGWAFSVGPRHGIAESPRARRLVQLEAFAAYLLIGVTVARAVLLVANR